MSFLKFKKTKEDEIIDKLEEDLLHCDPMYEDFEKLARALETMKRIKRENRPCRIDIKDVAALLGVGVPIVVAIIYGNVSLAQIREISVIENTGVVEKAKTFSLLQKPRLY